MHCCVGCVSTYLASLWPPLWGLLLQAVHVEGQPNALCWAAVSAVGMHAVHRLWCKGPWPRIDVNEV